jgi:NifU-like protein involved in Fe-S cluster formation
MRFLLHRQQPAAVMATTARRVQKEATKISKMPTAMRVPQVSHHHHHPQEEQAQHRPIRHAWGQQCSPSCGCIVRFEAAIDDDSKRIESITYHAKTLVTKTTSVPSSATATFGHEEQEQHEQSLQVVLTSKGRPMTKACTCTAVHTLCQAICSNLQQPQLQQHTFTRNHYSRPAPLSLSTVKNMMEFQSHRSSLAFARTVLLAQDLSPTKQQHCFDVVEEAFTAVIKGHLPKPRRQKSYPYRRIQHASSPLHDYDVDDTEPVLFPTHAAWPSTSRRKENPALERKPGESSSSTSSTTTTTAHDDDPVRAMHVGQFFFWNKDNHENDDRDLLYEDYGYNDDDGDEEEEDLVYKGHQHFAVANTSTSSSSSSSWQGTMVNHRGTPSSSSTLQMFELNLIMMMEEEERTKKRNGADNSNSNNNRRKPQPPRDWVSYVDEQLYYQEQQLSCDGEKAQVSA